MLSIIDRDLQTIAWENAGGMSVGDEVTYGIATKNTLEWIINFFAVSSFFDF